MDNRHFTPEALSLLAQPARWRLAASQTQTDLEPALSATPARVAWSRRHLHTHTYPEFMLVLRGEGVWGLNGQLYPTGPGAAFFISSRTRHEAYYPPDAGDLDHLWISLPGHGVFFSVHSLRGGRGVPARGGRAFIPPERLGIDVKVWLDDLSPTAPWRFARVRTCLQAIAVRAVEEGFRPPDPLDQTETLHEAVVEAVRQHLHETGGREASLDALARLVGYSKFHLHRLFRERAGMTIHRYADRCRLERLAQLERQGWTVARTAEALGFASAATFCRWRSRQRDLQLQGRQA